MRAGDPALDLDTAPLGPPHRERIHALAAALVAAPALGRTVAGARSVTATDGQVLGRRRRDGQ